MSLVLTRRPGEAIVFITKDGSQRRLYVVAVEGNTVRLAIDVPKEIQVVREELLPPEARRRWWEDRGGRPLLWWWAAAAAIMTHVLRDPVHLIGKIF